jgi:hypothetical protein
MLRWRPAQRAATCRLCSRDGRSMLRWPAVHAACTCRRLDMSPVPFLSPPVQQRQEEHAAHIAPANGLYSTAAAERVQFFFG